MDNRTQAETTPLRPVRVRAHKGPFRERMRERLHKARDAGERSAPFFLALAALMVPAMGILSFLPGESKRKLHTQGHFHSWGHLVLFILVGFILVRAGRNDRQRRWFFIAAMVMGFVIEIGEHLVFHGGLEWKDIFVDVTGVVGGTLVALATLGEIKRRRDLEASRAA